MTVVNIDRSVDDVVTDIARQDWNRILVPSLLVIYLPYLSSPWRRSYANEREIAPKRDYLGSHASISIFVGKWHMSHCHVVSCPRCDLEQGVADIALWVRGGRALAGPKVLRLSSSIRLLALVRVC
jgi:hypothetical protein